MLISQSDSSFALLDVWACISFTVSPWASHTSTARRVPAGHRGHGHSQSSVSTTHNTITCSRHLR